MKLTRLLATVALGLGLFAPTPASAKSQIKIATLAPKNSSWGKVYQVWQTAIDKKTNGELNIELFYNGVQGNETSMVAKMKTGQLDGAALTSVGLAAIYRNILVLQLPGVMTQWSELDSVREKLAPDLRKGFEDNGFYVSGWGDIGLLRQFSKGFGVRLPNDLKGKRPVTWRNEPMGPQIYAAIGGVVPVPLDPMEVVSTLRAGGVNVISAPSLAAEQLQWTPHLDHVTDQVSVCAVGGLVFRKQALDGLPGDLRKTFDEMQKRASQTQTDRIRKLDQEAYDRISKKMEVVHLTDADRDVWKALLKKVVTQLARGTFDKALVNKVLQMRGFEPVS